MRSGIYLYHLYWRHKTFSTQEALFEHWQLGDILQTRLLTVSWIPLRGSGLKRYHEWQHHYTSPLQLTPVRLKMDAWALKAKKKSKRFSAAVKDFLFEEFIRGVETGRKENPGLVSRKKIKPQFPQDDWLTTQQVASYFSCLACQQKCVHLTKVW